MGDSMDLFCVPDRSVMYNAMSSPMGDSVLSLTDMEMPLLGDMMNEAKNG
uniref:SERTA domain-containing protein n=1 Tax=Steinernema glaseri TaxID=37863 RepID=A0A1I7Y225_9BILA